MKEVNKRNEVGNTDEKLQKLEEYIETRLNELSKLTSMDKIHKPDWRGNRQEENVLIYIRDTFL